MFLRLFLSRPPTRSADVRYLARRKKSCVTRTSKSRRVSTTPSVKSSTSGHTSRSSTVRSFHLTLSPPSETILGLPEPRLQRESLHSRVDSEPNAQIERPSFRNIAKRHRRSESTPPSPSPRLYPEPTFASMMGLAAARSSLDCIHIPDGSPSDSHCSKNTESPCDSLEGSLPDTVHSHRFSFLHRNKLRKSLSDSCKRCA